MPTGSGIGSGNAEQFKIENAFDTDVVAVVGPGATLLWGPASANKKRTAGKSTYILWVTIHNPTAGQITAWLEVGGVAITPPFEVTATQSIAYNMPTPVTVGDHDVNCNASVATVQVQAGGYQI